MAVRLPTGRAAVLTAAALAVTAVGGTALALAARQPATQSASGHEGMSGMTGRSSAPGAAHDAHGGNPEPGAMGSSIADAAVPSGTSLSRDGYLLQLASPLVVSPTATVPFRFSVQSGGRAVTAFADENGKKMHLIVVRRDFAGFQHLHPTMAPDGTWSVPLRLGAPGSYRAYTDFLPADRAARGQTPLALATDLAAAGSWNPVPVPAVSATSAAGELTGTLSGRVRAGQASDLTFAVADRAGPVRDLQPYLGSFGHLVALRVGDLAYLHVHPMTPRAASPTLTFGADFPTPGRYRVFLQVQRAGVVTALPFTVDVPAA